MVCVTRRLVFWLLLQTGAHEMKTYRRVVALFAVLLAGLITAITIAAPGSEAAYVASIRITSPACTTGSIVGTGFQPNEHVVIRLSPGGQTVATATASPTGSFTVTATFPPSVKGSRLLIATGSQSTAQTRVLVNTTCGVAGQSSSRANGGTSSGVAGVAGVSSSRSSGGGSEVLGGTGVAVWTIGGLGVLLLAAGALFTFGGRRGRRA